MRQLFSGESREAPNAENFKLAARNKARRGWGESSRFAFLVFPWDDVVASRQLDISQRADVIKTNGK